MFRCYKCENKNTSITLSYISSRNTYFLQFESQDIQELKMIFQGQANIHETIKSLHHKLDEMVGRQEMTLSQVTSLKSQGGSMQQQGGATGVCIFHN